MESLILFLIAGITMALFSIPLIAICAALDEGHKKKELRRYARKQILRQMEREKEVGDRTKTNSF